MLLVQLTGLYHYAPPVFYIIKVAIMKKGQTISWAIPHDCS